jgi:hypothetical protein
MHAFRFFNIIIIFNFPIQDSFTRLAEKPVNLEGY